jgi:DNA-binding CsgD family transcriptional regulator
VVASEWPFGAPDAVTSVREYHPATGQLARVLAPDRSVGWSWIATVADEALWDDQGWRVTVRQVQLARDAGALDQLPILLDRMSVEAVWNGDFTAATSLIAEAEAVCEATGAPLAPVTAMMLAAFRGREAEAAPLTQSTIAGHSRRPGALGDRRALGDRSPLQRPRPLRGGTGGGQACQRAQTRIRLRVGVARADRSRRTHRKPARRRRCPGPASRNDTAGGTDSGLGIEARSRALLSEGGVADGHYREAIGRLGRARRRPELARAHLLYGEWLRRERRCNEAREQLRAAHGLLDEMGMEAFAERARRELHAVGETVRKRAAQTPSGQVSEPLTPQEARVARLARDGLSNPEIGARLFISTRTVQYHLSKVFIKLGISSRGQLHRAMPGDPDTPGLRLPADADRASAPARGPELPPLTVWPQTGRQRVAPVLHVRASSAYLPAPAC